MADYSPTEVTFEEMVLSNKHRLPITVKATEGVYTIQNEISNGDILKLLEVTDTVTAEFCHPKTSEKVEVHVPSTYEGGFLTVLRRGPDYVYSFVGEMAADFPPSVRVLEDINIQGTVVKRGEGLKLIRVQETKKGKSLLCNHIPKKFPLVLPFSMKGQFSPKRDDTIYTVNELKDRMPVLVKMEKNTGFAIRNASNLIPGIPDGFLDAMLLTKNTEVKVELWDDPGSFGIYDYATKKNMCLPIDLPITVVPAEGLITQYDPPEDLCDLAARNAQQGKPLFAMCCDKQKSLDFLDLPHGVILVIHRTERKQGLVCNGRSSNLLVPRDYKKTTLFKVCIS